MKGIGELCSQVNSGAMAGACRPMIRGPACGGGLLRLSWLPTSVAGISHRVAGRVVLRRLWRTLRRSSRSFHPVEVSLGTRRAASSLYAGTACSPCNPLAGRRVRPARGVALYCTGGVTGVPFRPVLTGLLAPALSLLRTIRVLELSRRRGGPCMPHVRWAEAGLLAVIVVL